MNIEDIITELYCDFESTQKPYNKYGYISSNRDYYSSDEEFEAYRNMQKGHERISKAQDFKRFVLSQKSGILEAISQKALHSKEAETEAKIVIEKAFRTLGFEF